MKETYNVYCDESCHLEKDTHPVMVLGAIWCPVEDTRDIAVRLREIKTRHGLKSDFEIKWVKLSPAKQQFYLDLLDYFFDNDNLHFRALIVPDKSKLRHADYQQTHDDWFYKMYFEMLKTILSPQAHYRIYLDIKDTWSRKKVANLHNVLSNDIYDFGRQVIERVQTVRSHEVEILQLTDLLTGTISYANRHLTTSTAKQTMVERMRKRSGYTLLKPTLYQERKVNLFYWQAREL